MDKKIQLTIDGKTISVDKGTTILQAANQHGISIPAICYHPGLTANGLCRVCSVDAGGKVQLAACVTECQENMEISTKNERVIFSRRTILELLASAVDLEEAPDIQNLLEEYAADTERYADGKRRDSPVYDDNPFYVRDYNQCINCWRCVQICADDAQYTYALSFDGRGFETRIGTFMGEGMMNTTCVFCGQCVGVCPTGALKPKRQVLLEQGIDPDDVFQQTRGGLKKIKAKNGKKGK
jgi:predicted molibdopterin-dependent oxidoreductase YjgC